MRLDLALVQKGFFTSRTKAQDAIKSDIVFYDNQNISKSSFDVTNLDLLEIRGKSMPYVSRGGLKLEKALNTFHVDLTNKAVLDIGSSTGGFTDCALQHGAKSVVAVDVGREQMDHALRENPAVTLYEETDFRTIETAKIDECSIAVSDVSFISITKMLPKLSQMQKLKEIICLIKPQFECGKEYNDKYHGIIKDPKIHEQALTLVLDAFQKYGFYLHAITYSPIQGKNGNIEYLAYFTPRQSFEKKDFKKLVLEAFQTFNGLK